MMALAAVFRLAGFFSEPHLTDADIHAVSGEPGRTSQSGAVRSTLTIVTWNIERGARFDRIADTLRSINADVVLLQEVDRFCRRSGNRDVARELATRTGMNWISAGEFQEVGEARGPAPAITGQAILSRDPITDAAVVRFSDQTSFRWRFNPFQPRRGGRMALRARTAGLLVYSVHLESGGDDELRARQLRDVLDDESRQASAASLVGGDFNNAAAFRSAMFRSLASAGFADALGSEGPRRTSIRHRHPIDWLFLKGITPKAGRVVPVDGASDHYPLIADVIRR
jgi:endonuclease/exonuclease/phosphatase family metal-dependent hydrolase